MFSPPPIPVPPIGLDGEVSYKGSTPLRCEGQKFGHSFSCRTEPYYCSQLVILHIRYKLVASLWVYRKDKLHSQCNHIS